MVFGVITQYVEPISKTTLISSVLQIISKYKILPVIDENSYPIGIVDLQKLYFSNLQANDTIEKCVSKCPISQTSNELLELKMDADFVCTLVIEDGQYVGFVDAMALTNAWMERCRSQKDELTRIINQKKRALKKALEHKNVKSLATLVAGIAHEVNTPLGICITAMSFFDDKTKNLQERYSNAKATKRDFEEYLAFASESAELTLSNLQTTIELIKEFKKVSIEQTGDYEIHSFEILPFVREVCKKLSPELNKKNVVVALSGNENIAITSNKQRFEQVITNLIMNSLIHGYKDLLSGGHIKIYVDADDTKFSLHYADDGKGINPSVIPHIFDPFFTTARGSGGTGLGMYISYNIVTQSLGGTIHCYESSTDGARFIINAPLEFKPHKELT